MGTLSHRVETGSKLAGVAVVIAASLTASVAFGQSRPAMPSRPAAPVAPVPPAGTGESPQMVSPYWNQPRDDQMSSNSSVRQTPATPDDLLSATVLAVPAARVQQVVASAQFRRLDSLLNRTTDMVRRDFIESDDYTKAVDKLRTAVAEFDHARDEAISGIKDTDEYRATMSLHKNVSNQIAEERENDNPDPQRLVALAEMKLDYVTPLRSVEREQIEASDDVRKARENLRAAAADVERLEHGFNKTFRNNTDLVALRQQRDDARIARLAANAFWYETRVARNIAIDYAYTSRLLNNNFTSYGGGGYANAYCGGYGYGGGYGYPFNGGVVAYNGGVMGGGPFTLGNFNNTGFFNGR